MPRETSVIIPVYNAFEEALACLKSVCAYQDGIKRIIVIDDASPKGEFATFVYASWKPPSKVTFFLNESNLGFVKTSNHGFELTGDDDVILLNSDTLVTPGWAKKIKKAAYSRPEVGSVTPLTNSGTICAVPMFLRDNSIPQGYTLNEFAELVELVSLRVYPEIPTSIGFCVYLKREMLGKVGYFDAEAFGRGYGEENDLSCRAKKHGFIDILDDSTYIYHKGHASFKEEVQELSNQNSKTLRELHPHYFDNVARFCKQNPLKEIQSRILDEMVLRKSASSKFTVLHVLQNGPFEERTCTLGGTELHVQGLINNIPEAFHWSLVPTKTCYYLSAHLDGVVAREYILGLGDTSLRQIFSSANFSLIHLHHSRYYDHMELCEALMRHPNYIISFHDYILVCPRFHLYTPTRRVCNGFECVSDCGYDEYYIENYRQSAHTLLKNAKKLVTFSKSTQDTITHILKDNGHYNWIKQSHGLTLVNPKTSQHADSSNNNNLPKTLKVAFLGYVPQHKGALIIDELRKIKTLPCGVDIEWHVVGKIFLDDKKGIIEHGVYNAENLPSILENLSLHLALFLTVCPETYSLTLDEAWNANIPALVTPYGAQPERVRLHNAGWVLKELSSMAVLEELNRLCQNWDEYLKIKNNITKVPLITIKDEATFYGEVYQNLHPGNWDKSLSSLLEYLTRFGLLRQPRINSFGRTLGAFINWVVYSLDHIGVRYAIQHRLSKLLPQRVLRTMKALR